MEDLERLEELESGKFEVGKDKITILTSQPVLPDKSAYYIAIPSSVRCCSARNSSPRRDVCAFLCPPLPKRPGDEAERRFRDEGYDFITLGREFDCE